MTKPPKRLERGLMELRTTSRGRRALRQLVLDRRAINPERFAHLRRELGLDATRNGSRISGASWG